LSKIEKKLAKIAPVNMAKTIENAMRNCMEGMINQLTDRVVGRFEEAADQDRKKAEIQRGKQVEATPENMSDIEFEPGATFSEDENEKVALVIERMQVDAQELEGSKHAPVISPEEKRQEFPWFTPSGISRKHFSPGGMAPSVDALRQSRQRNPGGGLLRARRRDHASRHILPSDCHFAVSSRSVGLLL